MKKDPFFSILIASYNNLQSLRVCISSINEQLCTDYELLISDGGSTDGIAELLNSGRIFNLSWFKSSKDQGIYDALNAALMHVRGRWVLVLGGDDRLADPGALGRFQAIVTDDISCQDIGVMYSDIYISAEQKRRIKKYPEIDIFDKMYWGGPFIHHQSAFVSNEKIKKVGFFDEKYRIHADYDLLLKVVSAYGAKKISGCYTVYNMTGYSSNMSNFMQSIIEVWKIRKSMSYFPLPPRLIATYLAVIVRKIISNRYI